MEMSEKIARYAELERRGMLASLPPEKQRLWSEIKARGLQQPQDPYDALDKAKYATRAAIEGATFGLGDMIDGAVNVLADDAADITHGRDLKRRALGAGKLLLRASPLGAKDLLFSQRAKKSRAAFVREQDAFAKAHPALNAGGEIAGGVLSAAFGGGGAVKAAAGAAAQKTGLAMRLLQSAGAGAKEGAKFGGLYGAGSGLTQDPDELSPINALFGAAGGAALGAPLGAAFGLGAKGLGAAAKGFKKAANAYKHRAYRAIEKAAGPKADQAILEKTALLDIADEPAMRLAEGAKLKEPQAAQVFKEYGEDRMGGQRRALEKLIDDHFGDMGFSQRMEKMDLDRQAQSGPLYQKAIYGEDKRGRRMDIKLNRDEQDYIAKVYRTTGYKNETRGLPYNHMRVLDYAKQLMDSDIARAVKFEDGNKVANLTKLKNDFLAKIDAQNPAYKEARGVFAKYERLKEAMRAGHKINTGSTKERQFDLEGMSADEQQYYTYGAREKLLENFNNFKSGKGNLAKKVFDQNTLARLRMLPVENLPRLEAGVQKEALAAENINRLMGGSQTAERQMSVGKTALNPRRTFKRWLSDKIDELAAPKPQEVARLMTDPNALAIARWKAMQGDIRLAREIGKRYFHWLRAAGPLVRKGENDTAKINSNTWKHWKKSPDPHTYTAIPYVRDIHAAGEVKRNVPNYKTRSDDFSSWDYYKKTVQTPEGQKDMLISVGQKPSGRETHGLNPDVESYFRKKNPSLSAGIIKPSTKEGYEASLGQNIKSGVNGKPTNSIARGKQKNKPFSWGEFMRALASPQAAGVGAVAAEEQRKKRTK